MAREKKKVKKVLVEGIAKKTDLPEKNTSKST